MSPARPAWYKECPAETWAEIALLSRDEQALHFLLRGISPFCTLPEDEEELRRLVGVSPDLWRGWSAIRHLWPVSGLRRGRTRARMNPLLGEALSEATEACATYRKRAKAGAAGRWKKDRALDASSNASSVLEGMQRERLERVEEREKKEPARKRAPGAFSSTSGEGVPGSDPAPSRMIFPPSAKALEKAELDAEAEQARRNREAQRRAKDFEAEIEREKARAIEAKFGGKSGADPNAHGLRLSGDLASCLYAGSWYARNADGKRWLTEDNTRPDGSSTMSNPKDAKLNEAIYAAMNALRAARVNS